MKFLGGKLALNFQNRDFKPEKKKFRKKNTGQSWWPYSALQCCEKLTMAVKAPNYDTVWTTGASAGDLLLLDVGYVGTKVNYGVLGTELKTKYLHT